MGTHLRQASGLPGFVESLTVNDDEATGPNVTPGRPKGSGRRAPWIVLGVAGFATLCFIAGSVIIALLLFL